MAAATGTVRRNRYLTKLAARFTIGPARKPRMTPMIAATIRVFPRSAPPTVPSIMKRPAPAAHLASVLLMSSPYRARLSARRLFTITESHVREHERGQGRAHRTGD